MPTEIQQKIIHYYWDIEISKKKTTLQTSTSRITIWMVVHPIS